MSLIIGHCTGIDAGNDVDPELLRGIYERVGECEFKPGSDHVTQVMRIEQMIVGKKPVCACFVVVTSCLVAGNYH